MIRLPAVRILRAELDGITGAIVGIQVGRLVISASFSWSIAK